MGKIERTMGGEDALARIYTQSLLKDEIGQFLVLNQAQPEGSIGRKEAVPTSLAICRDW